MMADARRQASEQGLGTVKRHVVVVGLATILLAAACGPARGPAGTGAIRNRGGGSADVEGWHGSVLDPALPAPDFTLVDPEGRPFRLSAQRGHPVLLFFGYTSCPDVCPTELGTWRRVRALLGADADRIRFVFITVDPERDTPEKVGKYVRSAGDPSFIGLSGRPEDLKPVWDAYSVYVKKEKPETPGGFYAVTHSSLSYLVAPDGRLRILYSFGTKAEDIAADLRRILSGG